MEIKEPISKELKSMTKVENTKETMSNQDQEISNLDKALIANGLPPSVRGNKTGYSIIFTNKPLQESKKKIK